MDKISGFQITGLRMSGFKSFSEKTELTFGNPTVITGGNGRGKSSIADAIAFAVTGVPFFGEKKIDRMHSDSNPDLYVALEFVDDAGIPHELIRIRKAGRTGISYDGRELRQMDLTEMFGEKEVFLSIFNPLYFIEELGEDGKNLLQRALPPISPADVLKELSEPARAALGEEELRYPEAHIKRLRENIRELENSLIYLQGHQDMAEKQRAANLESVQALEARLTSLEEELGGLEARRFAGMDRAEMENTLAELSARHTELAADREEEYSTAGLDDQILDLSRKLAERSASVYTSKFTQPIAEAAERVKTLASQYNAELAAFKAIAPGTVCPACRRAVTAADIPAVRASFQKSAGEIIRQGKEQQAQLGELKELDAKAEKVFQQYKQEDTEKLKASIQELTDKRLRLADSLSTAAIQRQKQLDELRGQMQSLTADLEYGALSQEEYDRMKELGDERQRLNAEIEARRNAELPTAKEFEERIAKAQEEISGLKNKVSCLLQYTAKRAELSLVQLKMNRVTISLFDVVKSTGEVKDVFKFEYNGRRYDRLSLSEKIRAGMEVSELMKRLTGRNYPVFVDNMESVDDLNNVRPTGQVLMAKCVSRTELKVRAVKPILTELPSAA